MQEPPNRYPGTENYLYWAYKTRPRPSAHKTLNASLASQDTQALKRALDGFWDAPPSALAVLARLQTMVDPAQIREPELPDLIVAWGRVSRDKPSGMDINEARFRHWASAGTWEDFFEHSVTAIRLLNSYNQPFDVGSLYRWVRYRCEHPLQFHLAVSTAFYEAQLPS